MLIIKLHSILPISNPIKTLFWYWQRLGQTALEGKLTHCLKSMHEPIHPLDVVILIVWDSYNCNCWWRYRKSPGIAEVFRIHPPRGSKMSSSIPFIFGGRMNLQIRKSHSVTIGSLPPPPSPQTHVFMHTAPSHKLWWTLSHSFEHVCLKKEPITPETCSFSLSLHLIYSLLFSDQGEMGAPGPNGVLGLIVSSNLCVFLCVVCLLFSIKIIDTYSINSRL